MEILKKKDLKIEKRNYSFHSVWLIDRFVIHGGFNILIKVLRRIIDGWWCGGGGFLVGGGSDEQQVAVVDLLINNCTTTNDEILVVVVAVEISLAAMHNMKLESSWWLWL